jgi:hypothetical protein
MSENSDADDGVCAEYKYLFFRLLQLNFMVDFFYISFLVNGWHVMFDLVYANPDQLLMGRPSPSLSCHLCKTKHQPSCGLVHSEVRRLDFISPIKIRDIASPVVFVWVMSVSDDDDNAETTTTKLLKKQLQQTTYNGATTISTKKKYKKNKDETKNNNKY